MSLALLSMGSMIDTHVKNFDGENIGEIKEIMVDITHGKIAYVVLTFGGFMVLGEKLFAIPWQAFTIDTVDEKLILKVKKETIKQAEGFDKDNWPNMADVQWNFNTYAFYGYEPYWE